MDPSPYLEWIDRKRLDFDFERICSVTLTKSNVYVCLTCGKFFHGRSHNSPLHCHTLQESHPLHMHLETGAVYLMPDGVQVEHPSAFSDIRYNLNPRYGEGDLGQMMLDEGERVDLHGRPYVRGFLGMNNLKASDYASVVLQALLHIPPLQRHFLLDNANDGAGDELKIAIRSLFRRYWNASPFKAIINPHGLMQVINRLSNKRFSVLQQSDPIELVTWLLHHGLPSAMATSIFGGRVTISSAQMKDVSSMANLNFQSKESPFLHLTLDLPPMPLYQSKNGEYVTPQVSLVDLLRRYDGGQITQRGEIVQTFSLQSLPPFLMLSYRRLTQNHGEWQKNRTLVTHPLTQLPISTHQSSQLYHYRLLANIIHIGEVAKGGKYAIQVVNPHSGHWYEIDDLNVKRIPSINITLSECTLQIWQREIQ